MARSSTKKLEAAIRYAELGYPVFPLLPKSKKPFGGQHQCRAVTHQQGCLDATTDEETVEAWFEAHPEANIGVSTQGLFVVDVDPFENGSQNTFLHDQPELFEDLNATAVSESPRGGRHCWFTQKPGMPVKNSAGKIGESVDVRGDGGYLVVAPSYVIDQAKGIHGGYRWIDELPERSRLLEAPNWLYRLIPKDAPKLKSKSQSDDSETIVNGQRNDTLYRIGCKLRRDGFGQKELEAILHCTNVERCVTPIPEDEVDKIIESVLRHDPDEKSKQEIFVGGKRAFTPKLTRMSTLARKQAEFLWPNVIPSGCLTLIVGHPGAGKSLFSIDASARVSTGRMWPDGSRNQLGSVLLMTSEDSPEHTIGPRLDAAGADSDRVYLMTTKSFNDGKKEQELLIGMGDIELIRDALDEIQDCRMIVVDPCGNHLGGEVDMHKDNEVRSILAPLAQLAAERHLAVLLVCHSRKSGSSHADDIVLGSRGFVGASRQVWHVVEDPDDSDRVLMLAGKTNLCKKQDGFAYRIEGETPFLRWDEERVQKRANDLFGMKPDREAPVLDEAEAWLQHFLSDGPKSATEVKREAEKNMITLSTLKRAKSSLGVISSPDGMGGSWKWSLPDFDSLLLQNTDTPDW